MQSARFQDRVKWITARRELSKTNDWRREYDRQRWPRRKAMIVEYLGGRCGDCGIGVGPFEFDHVDPSTKRFTISKRPNMAWEKLVVEVDKCQLLCEPCHLAKTATEQTTWQHGTIHGYYNHKCRCPECRGAYSDYRRALRARKKAASEARSWGEG